MKIDGNLTLRTLLLSGDFFLGSIVGTTLTKLVLRLNELQVNPALKHSFTAEVCIVRLFLFIKSLNLVDT